MARLSAAPLLLLAAAAAPAPAQEPTLAQARDARALQRLQETRRENFPDELSWRKAEFALLIRLEHAPVDSVLPYWERVAQLKSEPELGNHVLYCRRHALPLPPELAEEGQESALERALAWWGARRLPEARQALEQGGERFPQDLQFRQNLDWLLWRAPDPVDPKAGARAAALAVLSARRPAP